MLIEAGKPNAGRMPATERESLIKFLEGNGFDEPARNRARSAPTDRTDLDRRFHEVADIDGEIDQYAGKEN